MKDNRRMRMIFTVIVSAILMILITGCADSEKNVDETSSVAVVVGAHANSMALNLNSPILKEQITKSINSSGMVAVISNDGEPEVISGKSYEIKEQYKGNPELLEQISEKETVKTLKAMEEVRANDPEVDTLEALRISVRALSSAPKGSRTVLICDTGLSTKGILDFTNNIINADPKEVADQLDERSAIPDLRGVHILWQQMADVCEPQQTLTPAQTKNLRDIWKAIIEKGGGTFESTDAIPNPGGVAGDLPEVTTVALPAETAIMFDPEDVHDFDEPTYLGEEQVKFAPDSDQYVDDQAAEKAIRPVADHMNKNKGLNILLIGTTAGDENTNYTMELSRKRAEAVRRTLLSLGVDAQKVTCIGLGNADPWHLEGLGTGDGLASNNRKVVLVNANSDIAKEMIEKEKQL